MGIRNYIDPARLKADVAFSDVDLDSAMMNQASLYVHYGQAAAQAQFQMDQAENRLEITRAKVGAMIRDEAAAGTKKLTEALIAERITTHDDVVRAQKEFNLARHIYELARHACEALKQRRDMLVQVGKRQLEEQEGQVRIQKQDQLRNLSGKALG
jgi:hypothetical protein